jgi:ribosomal protein S18 acetylase RimI-like enzyme
MLNVRLRAVTERDSEWAFQVKKASLGEYIDQTWGWDEGFQRQFHQNDFEPAKTQIIMEGSHDAGWIVVAETDTEFQLRELYLHPAHQCRGIGSHLVEALLAEAERQQKPVELHVLKVNARARQLYERLRFRLTGETDTHYIMRAGGPEAGQG